MTASSDAILERLRELLQRGFKIDPQRVQREATFRGSLGLDSMDILDVVHLVSREYKIEGGVQPFERLDTVGKVVDFIAAELEKRPAR